MRNAVSMVSVVSLSICFAACSDDDGSNSEATANANTPIAEADAGPTTGPMVSPLATTIAPAPPPASVEAPAPKIDLDAGVEDVNLPPQDAGSDAGGGAVIIGVPMIFVGKINAIETGGASCFWYIDGVSQNDTPSTFLSQTALVGTHTVKCSAYNLSVEKTVDVKLNTTSSVILTLPPPPPPGTLVAVAVGGSCTWYLNGASKGTSAQYETTLVQGTYSIACYVGGVSKGSRSVIIKPGETAMAMFKLNADAGAP